MCTNKSKIWVFLISVIFAGILSGCGYEEMEGTEVTDYLSARYGGKFEIISVEEKERCDRDYLDEDM